MKKQGLSIHCHHNILIEYCYDYDARVKAIKTTKPKNEQETRLRLFAILPQEAIDELPVTMHRAYADLDKAYTDVDNARVDWYKTSADWDKARADWDKTYADVDKVRADWYKANADWYKANADLDKANADWYKACADWTDKNAWHAKWCGCNEWDGKEIAFPKPND